MNRVGDYSLGKRQRESQKARKKQEKSARRMQKREQGTSELEITTADAIVGNLPSSEEALRAMEERAAAPRGVATIPCRLFVGGVSATCSEAELRGAFAEYGGIVEAVIVKDRTTGQSRGFGFVTMENRKDAGRAIDGLNGTELAGRRLMVNVATDRPR
jgi:RNA recognition motif-containing protein